MNNVKYWREKSNLIQSELAEKSGVSLRTIQRIEAGSPLKGFTLNAIAKTLETNPENLLEKETFDFKFKKRKIIIPGVLDGKDEKFLYDSGASAFELLTTKEIWEKSKLKNSKIKIEKGKSWDNILTTYIAETNKNIEFQHIKIPLHEITYVDGYSKSQYYLMKYSGMLGNKIFSEKQVYIDAKDMKMAIHE